MFGYFDGNRQKQMGEEQLSIIIDLHGPWYGYIPQTHSSKSEDTIRTMWSSSHQDLYIVVLEDNCPIRNFCEFGQITPMKTMMCGARGVVINE